MRKMEIAAQMLRRVQLYVHTHTSTRFRCWRNIGMATHRKEGFEKGKRKKNTAVLSKVQNRAQSLDGSGLPFLRNFVQTSAEEVKEKLERGGQED